MGLSAKQIRQGVDAVAAGEPAFARALGLAGYPEPRIRPTGYRTLLRTIVGQQVSVAAASSMWTKFEALLGEDLPVEAILASNFDALPDDDEEAIARLTLIKGIGRWSAEIYLLFAEGRPDIWPAGDLAVQAGVGRIMAMDERPSEKQVRDLAEAWRPHRGAVAIFTWHCYNNAAL